MTPWAKAFADFTRIYHQITAPERPMKTTISDDDRLDSLIETSLDTDISLDLIEAITRGLDGENHNRVLSNFRQNVRANFVLFRKGEA